jgi:hypothetical protein
MPKRYIPRVNLRVMEKRVKAIMNREVMKLLDLSAEKLLNKTEAESLRAYAKLIPELAKREEEEHEKVSDKELKRIIAAANTKAE